MGGNAFPNLNITRISRENINPTLKLLANTLKFENLNYDYMINNLLGSANKQSDSGDLDIAVNSDMFSKKQFAQLGHGLKDLLKNHANLALKADQINIAWPIITTEGYVNKNEDLVQIDFIYGNAEWLRFSHWSPGKDRSPFKGVFISQAFGVLAKSKVIWRHPINAIVDKDNNVDERLAEISYALDLEKGLKVRTRLRLNNGNFSEVDYDTFETKCSVIPIRVPRFGYITDPNAVLRILVGDVSLSDVETFENLMKIVKENNTSDFWHYFKDRLNDSLMHSGAKREPIIKDLKEFLDNV